MKSFFAIASICWFSLAIAQPHHFAGFTIPVSPEERAWLNNPFSGTDDGAAVRKRFNVYMLKRYPEIAKVRYVVPPELKGQPEDIAVFRDDFRLALFYAEQIKLADGQTLFHLLTACGEYVSNATSATVDALKPPGQRVVNIRFYPAFKRIDGNEGIERDIMFDRLNEKVTAFSPAFSTSVIEAPNFMQMHGVRCAK